MNHLPTEKKKAVRWKTGQHPPTPPAINPPQHITITGEERVIAIQYAHATQIWQLTDTGVIKYWQWVHTEVTTFCRKVPGKPAEVGESREKWNYTSVPHLMYEADQWSVLLAEARSHPAYWVNKINPDLMKPRVIKDPLGNIISPKVEKLRKVS